MNAWFDRILEAAAAAAAQTYGERVVSLAVLGSVGKFDKKVLHRRHG